MARRYEKGLHDLGNGLSAWLQPDGSWGYSNAGLITDAGEALLVDTLFDLRLTGEMLAAMRAAIPAARTLGTVVNTHANGDHCYGNQLIPNARFITSRAAAEELAEVSPAAMAQMIANADALGEAGRFFAEIFGSFDFRGIEVPPPTDTFDGELTVAVGTKQVHLIEVGPAHTRGDVIVHVPGDGVVFTGDILFIDGTPILWAGPVGNWISACERIASMGAITIVPGHGPLTDASGALVVRDYLVYVRDEARKRYDAGLTATEAVHDIALGDYASWGDAERIAVNVHTLYREFTGSRERPNPIELFGLMAKIARPR